MDDSDKNTLINLVNAELQNRITAQIEAANIAPERQAMSDIAANRSREEARESK